MITKTAMVLVFMLGIQSAKALASPQTNDAPVIEPVPSIQTWIKQVVALESQPQLQEAIATFKKQGLKTEVVIQQLICFQANAKRIYSGENLAHEEVTKKAMVANGVIAFLLDWDIQTQRLTSSSSLTLVKAVLPYLRTPDRQLKKELQHTLEWVDQMQGAKKDFTYYEVLLSTSAEGLMVPLVVYMYDSDPSAAVVSMARVYGDKSDEVDVATAVKDDARAVEHFSKRPEWWAQLYAAEKLRRNPELRCTHILDRLQRSDHPLVKARVAEIIFGK